MTQHHSAPFCWFILQQSGNHPTSVIYHFDCHLQTGGGLTADHTAAGKTSPTRISSRSIWHSRIFWCSAKTLRNKVTLLKSTRSWHEMQQHHCVKGFLDWSQQPEWSVLLNGINGKGEGWAVPSLLAQESLLSSFQPR